MLKYQHKLITIKMVSHKVAPAILSLLFQTGRQRKAYDNQCGK